MTSGWQYQGPVSTNKGYWVDSPGVKADAGRSTISITDQSGNVYYCFIHEIEANFQMGGNYAQSAQQRDWYPRNFAGIQMAFTGQCASQSEYHTLAEFIRSTQKQSLDYENVGTDSGMVLITLPKGTNVNFTGQSMRGHIRSIERRSEQFQFAPEFQFEFIVATSHTPFLEIQSANKEVSLRRLKSWMDVFIDRKGATWEDISQVDHPDPPPKQVGPHVPANTPGPNGSPH